MKRNLGIAATAFALTLAFAGAAGAQTSSGGGTGTDTSKSAAGTGNAGDKTTEVGTPAAKSTHKHHKRAKKAADMAASGSQQ